MKVELSFSSLEWEPVKEAVEKDGALREDITMFVAAPTGDLNIGGFFKFTDAAGEEYLPDAPSYKLVPDPVSILPWLRTNFAKPAEVPLQG